MTVTDMNLADKRILVTGAHGFLGPHVVHELFEQGAEDVYTPTREDYDLTLAPLARSAVRGCDLVVHLAARVGGIGANQDQPGVFFHDNMAMGLNIVEACRLHQVQRLLVVGTVCAYPKHCEVPFSEAALWNGYPEHTNASYGIAKKAILEMQKAYARQYGMESSHVIPTNLYGPGDHYDLQTSHVIPAMVRKFVEARRSGAESVTLWGTGAPSREFLHVRDAARGIVTALRRCSKPIPINLGAAKEITMNDLAAVVALAAGFHGDIVWDSTKPDGQPRRSVAGVRAASLLQWFPRQRLATGVSECVADFERRYPE